MADPAAVIVPAVLLGMVLLYVWSIVWAYGDAKARGKPGFLVALLVALVNWPGGLLAWLVFRPSHRLPSGPCVRSY